MAGEEGRSEWWGSGMLLVLISYHCFSSFRYQLSLVYNLASVFPFLLFDTHS